MLGRKVAEVIREHGPDAVVADEVVAVAHEADLLVVNLECCISERGERRREPGKPFFFRAPPQATSVLRRLGADCVTLANNHALDYGVEAMLDTLAHLDAAGIAYVGGGTDVAAARAPGILEGRVRDRCRYPGACTGWCGDAGTNSRRGTARRPRSGPGRAG